MVIKVNSKLIDLSLSQSSVIHQAQRILSSSSVESEIELVDFLFSERQNDSLYARYLLKRMYNSSIYALYPSTYLHLNKRSRDFIELYPKEEKVTKICEHEYKLSREITVLSRKGEKVLLKREENRRNGYVRTKEELLPSDTVSIIIGRFPDSGLGASEYEIIHSEPRNRFPSAEEYNEAIMGAILFYRTSSIENDNQEPTTIKIIQISSETAAIFLDS